MKEREGGWYKDLKLRGLGSCGEKGPGLVWGIDICQG